MQTKTGFEGLLDDLSFFSGVSKNEILHSQAQIVAKMYRFLTGDLEAIDIVISKIGRVQIYKDKNEVLVSKKHRDLIVWATFRFFMKIKS